MKALALTDHGVLYGAIEFYQEAKRQGVKPIIGVEAYVAPNRLTDKRAKIDDSAFHLILLAEDMTGYRNLLKLVTLAHLEGFYYKPRVDKAALREHHAGLIALSGCLGGEVSQALLQDDFETARRAAETYGAIFGRDNFFLEIQSHPALPEQNKVNAGLLRLAKELNLQLVATRDSHYLAPDDKEAQDALVCIQTGKQLTDTNRLNMTAIDLDLCGSDIMAQAFHNQPEAVANTVRIADRCNVDLKLGTWVFPDFPVPVSETPNAYLSRLAADGLRARLGAIEPEADERLRYELDIIATKGYATYFLVVADFVGWSRQRGIISTTRGSAAGSLVAFALGITTVNPLEYRLPFERFLNPWRPLPPDIDMDFADDRRDEVIAYVKEKYGADRVAQIVTFGTMQARAAVRDIGRVLGYQYSFCDRLAKMVPFGAQGFHMSIERALELNSELKARFEAEPEVQRLLELAQKVEGCARHASVHAAGVVIAPRPLTEYLPLQREAGGDKIVTQYDMHAVEEVGLLKMDFLGIRNLSILGSAVELIQKIHGTALDLNALPLDDKKTYKLLAEGQTMGLFQLSGSGMTRHLKELKPTSIYDIMAMVALFRPGPMNSIPEYIRRKHNPRLVTYLDPRLKPILERSYGIITYQDDVLLIAVELAGYSWEEADKLRRAMGKKIQKEMAAQREKFFQGCLTHGRITGDKAEELWKLIEPFAAYGFNKAHAASYGIVAYQTAYLKAHFPAEYMTAVLTAESGDLDTVAAIVSECRRMGIAVLPPSINESTEHFTRLDEHHIRFGLLAIKNVGSDIAGAIIAERARGGSFQSLEDFLARASDKNLNKKVLEALIKAGALDEWGDRQQLLSNIEALLKYHRGVAAGGAITQAGLFGDWQPRQTLHLEPSEPATKEQSLAWERELLGLYLTEHPLQQFQGELSSMVVPLAHLPHYHSEELVVVSGLADSVRRITTKTGEAMAFVKFSDLDSSIEVVVFPSIYRTTAAVLESGQPLLVAGKVSRRDGEIKIICEGAEALRTDTVSGLIKRWSKIRFVRRDIPVEAEDVVIEEPV